MKKIVYFFAFAALLALGLSQSSCKEESIAEVFGTMEADLVVTETPTDGGEAKETKTAWKAKVRYGKLESTTKTFTIAGTASSILELGVNLDADETIGITVRGTEEKAYKQVTSASQLKAECVIFFRKTKGAQENADGEKGADYYASSQSTVDVTKIDTSNKRISGTFTATLVNSKGEKIKIEGGEFRNLRYQ